VILACLCILVDTITVLSLITYEPNYRHIVIFFIRCRLYVVQGKARHKENVLEIL
jgi:hypothetical protein